MEFSCETPFLLEGEQVVEELSSNSQTGLSQSEAERRLSIVGLNVLPEEEKKPLWKLVMEQFEDKLVLILLAAAFISFVLAFFEEDESMAAFFEPLVILLILILNAIVGVVQESSAEKAIEALKQYEAVDAEVIRDGAYTTIPANELVPGDIIKVSVGQKVPADSRLLSKSSLLGVDQSILTGESDSVSKFLEEIPTTTDKLFAQDKVNMLFSGTLIVRGYGIAVVTGTASNTEIGRIHKGMSEQDESKTPLQMKLDEFGDQLTKYIMVVCILVWAININNFTDPVHGSLFRGAVYYFKIAVALAVAAIPEGLPAVVTTCLALGTRKMAKKNAIVRSLPSVETLGCTTVICSDKTGTLTTNMMSVRKVLFFGDNPTDFIELDIQGDSFDPTVENPVSLSGKPINEPILQFSSLEDIAAISSLCNESRIFYEDGKFEKNGEATEAALKVLAEKLGTPVRDERLSSSPSARADWCSQYWNGIFEKKQTLEFTRQRKSMSVLLEKRGVTKAFVGSSAECLAVKGAPEFVIQRCTKVRLNNGRVVSMDEKFRETFLEKLETYANNAYRCLALAYVDTPKKNLDYENNDDFEQIESDMVFVGMVGMIDPPRSVVRESIETCRLAGIRVIVITGDNKITAEAICRDIGIFDSDENLTGKSFTGAEFEKLTPQEQENAVRMASLFSRVEPTHKLRLVQLLQNQGEVVAMTGDGVNDAPALKRADIGIAMGTGTAVAREASDMVLADDNFATIVTAVREGRGIYSNTKQFIRYLISSNIGEVACIFITAALGIPEALIPVQLLWVNLVTDGLPATALGFNPEDKDVMRKPPRSKDDSIINGWMFFRYLAIGLYVGVAVVLGFAWWYTMYAEGPQISFSELASFHSCVEGKHAYSCSIFTGTEKMRASTVALSILVIIEMFNALNAVSENQSLVKMPPWVNIWLILAVILSIVLHFFILYIPYLANVFSVSPINQEEWIAVVAFSAPVLVIDEILKFFSRNNFAKNAKVKNE